MCDRETATTRGCHLGYTDTLSCICSVNSVKIIQLDINLSSAASLTERCLQLSAKCEGKNIKDTL